jgi:hypothetical protein
MRMSKAIKTTITVFILSSLIALLVWAFLQGRIEHSAEEDRERPVKAPSRVSVVGGETVITVDVKAQETSGIITEPLIRGYFPSPVGTRMHGIIVPDLAVIWLKGKAWIYIRKDAVHFVRHEIPVDHPAGGWWFVTDRFSPGDRVAVRGAQLLLSEEFRSQIRMTD